MQYTAVDMMNEPSKEATAGQQYIHNVGISFIAIYWSISCVYLLHLR